MPIKASGHNYKRILGSHLPLEFVSVNRNHLHKIIYGYVSFLIIQKHIHGMLKVPTVVHLFSFEKSVIPLLCRFYQFFPAKCLLSHEEDLLPIQVYSNCSFADCLKPIMTRCLYLEGL